MTTPKSLVCIKAATIKQLESDKINVCEICNITYSQNTINNNETLGLGCAF